MKQIHLVYDEISKFFHVKVVISGLESYTQISKEQFDEEVDAIITKYYEVI